MGRMLNKLKVILPKQVITIIMICWDSSRKKLYCHRMWCATLYR